MIFRGLVLVINYFILVASLYVLGSADGDLEIQVSAVSSIVFCLLNIIYIHQSVSKYAQKTYRHGK